MGSTLLILLTWLRLVGMGEVDGILEFGDRFIGVTALTSIGDLFNAGVALPPIEEVDAELNAGLALGGVPNTPKVLVGAGVLIIDGAIDVLEARTGLRLQLLLSIGVSLEFVRTGPSCQLGPTWLILLLFMLLFIFVSSKELLLLTANEETHCEYSVCKV